MAWCARFDAMCVKSNEMQGGGGEDNQQGYFYTLVVPLFARAHNCARVLVVEAQHDVVHACVHTLITENLQTLAVG